MNSEEAPLIVPDVITTPRLILEFLTPDHADALFVGLCDDRLFKFIDEAPAASVESLRLRYKRLALGVSPDGREIWRNWAVRCRHEDRYVGFVQATIAEDRSTEIAYVLFHACWGCGYGREAVTAMMMHLRDEHAIKTFWAKVDPRNIRSVALLESLGFQLMDYRVKCITIHGTPADESIYMLSETKI